MKVKCINNIGNWGDSVRLTVGKVYNVAEIRTDGYLIKNDDETLACYYTYRFEEVEEVEKEKVLEVEFQEVFDKVAWRIAYQNEEAIIKNKFEDGGLGFTSVKTPAAYPSKFVLYNSGEIEDSGIGIMSKEASEKFKDIVREVNEEYGIPKKWRANIGEVYYYIDSDGTIIAKEECGTTTDERRHKFGNYAKTKKELEFEKLEKVKQILQGE